MALNGPKPPAASDLWLSQESRLRLSRGNDDAVGGNAENPLPGGKKGF